MTGGAKDESRLLIPVVNKVSLSLLFSHILRKQPLMRVRPDLPSGPGLLLGARSAGPTPAVRPVPKQVLNFTGCGFF